MRRKVDEETQLLKILANSITERASRKATEPKNAAVTSFGKFVMESLLEMEPMTRKIAQHQISNVIFQAQMGCLKHQQNCARSMAFPDQSNTYLSSSFQIEPVDQDKENQDTNREESSFLSNILWHFFLSVFEVSYNVNKKQIHSFEKVKANLN